MRTNDVIIQFGGLGVGTHIFEYEVKNRFFEQFEYSEVQRANLIVTIEFVKQNSVTTLHFKTKGLVGITCDRCAGDYDISIESNETLYLKNGDVNENNENLIVLPFGETEVNLTKYIYEFIVIALPIRRVPCELNKELYKCDEETLKKLTDFTVDEETNQPENNIWEELKKVKFNNN